MFCTYLRALLSQITFCTNAIPLQSVELHQHKKWQKIAENKMLKEME